VLPEAGLPLEPSSSSCTRPASSLQVSACWGPALAAWLPQTVLPASAPVVCPAHALPSPPHTPTTRADSNLAFVCDLGNRGAVEKLLEIKRLRGSQKMSILCRSLQDVDTYTTGWPPSRSPGQPDLFKLVRRVLPGPVSGWVAGPGGGREWLAGAPI
jgi:hypothetical protein